MESYANWSLKPHNYIGKAGGAECATNQRVAATLMTPAGGRLEESCRNHSGTL